MKNKIAQRIIDEVIETFTGKLLTIQEQELIKNDILVILEDLDEE
jgi:hypothetical protein